GSPRTPQGEAMAVITLNYRPRRLRPAPLASQSDRANDSSSRRLRIPAIPAPSATLVAFVASTIFLGLWADAVLHERSFFDAWSLNQVQRIDNNALAHLFDFSNGLTGSTGAIAAWVITLAVLAAARWWVPALATAMLPIGGALNFVVGELSR